MGIASRFSDSMTLMSWQLGLPPLNLTCAANAQPPSQRAHRLPPLSREGRAAVERFNALDLELYEYGLALWEERWRRMQLEAPERWARDSYERCHNVSSKHCSTTPFSFKAREGGSQSPMGRGLTRCATYCVNSATDERLGARLSHGYRHPVVNVQWTFKDLPRWAQLVVRYAKALYASAKLPAGRRAIATGACPGAQRPVLVTWRQTRPCINLS